MLVAEFIQKLLLMPQGIPIKFKHSTGVSVTVEEDHVLVSPRNVHRIPQTEREFYESLSYDSTDID